MTNLQIIKYLALNDPARLGELLEDIYCSAWNDGANFTNDNYHPTFGTIEMSEWLYDDASKLGLYFEDELEEWSKVIDNNTIEVAYANGLTIELPYKDPDHMWNINNDFEVKKYPEKENKNEQ